jgi:hypothetical protein
VWFTARRWDEPEGEAAWLSREEVVVVDAPLLTGLRGIRSEEDGSGASMSESRKWLEWFNGRGVTKEYVPENDILRVLFVGLWGCVGCSSVSNSWRHEYINELFLSHTKTPRMHLDSSRCPSVRGWEHICFYFADHIVEIVSKAIYYARIQEGASSFKARLLLFIKNS